MSKISIIIPCYNVEKYLRMCLDSVLRQTMSDIEVICIDDGSIDTTPEILDEYHLCDSRVLVIHQSNQGVSAARNLGMRSASGEFIAFMDSDDFYPDCTTLQLLYSKSVENHALVCGGSFSTYDDSSGRISTRFFGDYAKYTFRKEGWISFYDYQFDFGYQRFLYNRSFLLEHNIFFPPYKRFQDPPFFVKSMILAGSFYSIPNIVYRYRIGIQEEPISWRPEKLHDMLSGHLDVLRISSQYQLAQLHALTVRRLEENNVFVPVMQSLEKKDHITLDLLWTINSSINIVLLRQIYTILEESESYTLRELRAIPYPTSHAVKPLKSLNQSFITSLFLKIRNGFRCCIEHGCLYTLKRIFIKIDKRK